MSGPLAVLELYCGIGGCAAALPALPVETRVAAALDINTRALRVYRRSFPGHRAEPRNLEAVSSSELAAFGADLWWLSPPCQPFTRRGLGRDADDPRARSLLHLIRCMGEVRPRAVALENVPGFEGSRVHDRLRATLDRAGYRVRETLLCPSELGVPNRRRRYYLTAGLDRDPAAPRDAGMRADAGGAWDGARLPDLIGRRPGSGGGPAADSDPAADPDLLVDPALARRYEGALHIVDPDDPDALTACFTAAYGRSPVRSGSYLRLPPVAGEPRLRRFAPHEILRLLGFPADYGLPPDLPAAQAWPLVGNSLSVPAVHAVLAPLVAGAA